MNIMFQLGTCRASLHMTYQYIANETQKKWMKPKSNIISFVRGGCRPEVPQKNVLGFCQVVGIWHFCCRQWNGHMTIVRASP